MNWSITLDTLSHQTNLPARQLGFLFAMIAAIVLGVARYLDQVIAFGHDIAQSDMAGDYLKGVVWALCLGASILLWPVSADNKKCLLFAWLVKILVTLGFMLLYENYYGVGGSLDGYMYFDESHKAGFSLATLNLTEGTTNITNLARLHRQLCPDSYHAMKVSCAMLGLVGIYLFYRAGVIFLGREDRRIFYLLCLFPGILFWSSILGKDPLVFFGIALYCYGVVGWTKRRFFRFLFAVALGILVATFIRQWLGIIMLVPLGVLFLHGVRGLGAKIAFGLFVALALYLSAGPFMKRFHIAAMSDLLSAADRTTKGFVNTAGGSTQQLNVDLTSTSGLVKFLPVAAFTALFRPLPGEILNPFGLLAGLENALLLTLLALALVRGSWRDLKEPLVLWALAFLGVWSLLNGIVSSANFGVAVRYKLQVLPVLLGVLFYLARKRQPLGAGPVISGPVARGTAAVPASTAAPASSAALAGGPPFAAPTHAADLPGGEPQR